MLKEEKDLRISFIEITPSGELDLEHYATLLEQKPKLVAFTHMSNVTGTINPAQTITKMDMTQAPVPDGVNPRRISRKFEWMRCLLFPPQVCSQQASGC
jgi:hypothetical protein